MADSSEPAFLFLYRKEAVAPVDYLSTFATAPFLRIMIPKHNRMYGIRRVQSLSERISDKQNTVGKEKGNVQIIFNGK